MSRGQVRFIIALTVVVTLLIVAYQLITTLRIQRQQEHDLAHLAKDIAPETAQRMQNFRRAKIRDGKKVWEIAAQQARYMQESNEILVEEPEVSLFVKDGDVIALRCQEGRVHLGEDEDVIRMELSGGLEMRVNDFVITTPEAVYESERSLIFSEGPIRLVGQGVEVEGRGYTVDILEKRLTLNAEVHTTVTRRDG